MRKAYSKLLIRQLKVQLSGMLQLMSKEELKELLPLCIHEEKSEREAAFKALEEIMSISY